VVLCPSDQLFGRLEGIVRGPSRETAVVAEQLRERFAVCHGGLEQIRGRVHAGRSRGYTKTPEHRRQLNELIRITACCHCFGYKQTDGFGLRGGQVLAEVAQGLAEGAQPPRVVGRGHGHHQLLRAGLSLRGEQVIAEAAQGTAEGDQLPRVLGRGHGRHQLLRDSLRLRSGQALAKAAQGTAEGDQL